MNSGKVFLNGFNRTLVGEGTIDATHIQLFEVVNKPSEVVDAIFKYYEHRGLSPSPEEQEMPLHF